MHAPRRRTTKPMPDNTHRPNQINLTWEVGTIIEGYLGRFLRFYTKKALPITLKRQKKVPIAYY